MDKLYDSGSSEAHEAISEAREKLLKDLKRAPSVPEIAAEAGVDTAAVERVLVEEELKEREAAGGATLSERTERISHRKPEAEGDVTGICLSGGGIRAASFAMGVLQALEARESLKEKSLLSLEGSQILTAVSGGGYTGGAFEMDRSHGVFELDPLATPRPLAPGTVEELYVRQRSSFLARTAREKFRLFVHLLIGVAVNAMFLAALLYVVLRPAGWFLGRLLPTALANIGTNLEGGGWFSLRFTHLRGLFPAALWLSIAVTVILGVGLAIAALVGVIANLAPWDVDKEGRVSSLRETLRSWSDSAVVLALCSFALLIVIPFAVWLFYDLIPGLLANGPAVVDFFEKDGAGGEVFNLFAAGGSLAFLAAAAKSQLSAVAPTWWARIAAFAVVPLMALWVAAVIVRGAAMNGVLGATSPVGMSELARWGVVLFLLCVFWLFADQRSWSLYPIYRERLEKAFAVERLWKTPRKTADFAGVLTQQLDDPATKELGESEARRVKGSIDAVWMAGVVEKLRPDLIPAFATAYLRRIQSREGFGTLQMNYLRNSVFRALDETSPESDAAQSEDDAARTDDDARSGYTAWRIWPKIPVRTDGRTTYRYIDFAKTYEGASCTGDDVLYGESSTCGPAFISCAAANVRDVEQTAPDLQAASFHFSHETIGSPHGSIGTVSTEDYQRALDGTIRRQDITVPAAMAMSGAAISPAMGKQTKRWLAAFMALANARLGVWLPNPRWVEAVLTDSAGKDAGEAEALASPVETEEHAPTDEEAGEGTEAVSSPGLSTGPTPIWHEKPRVSYLLKEILGVHALDDRFLYITDGGHYDNLGLVELLRRACNTIVVVDASGDEPGVFTTFGQAMALARAELGVWFDIDLDGLRGDDESVAGEYEEKQLKLPWRRRTSQARGGVLMKNAYVWGTFHYRAEGEQPSVEGRICYIQTAVTRQTPWQVRAYWEDDPRFPNHSTLDQSFSFEEFEAYRALGYWAGESARYKRAAPDERSSTDEARGMADS